MAQRVGPLPPVLKSWLVKGKAQKWVRWVEQTYQNSSWFACTQHRAEFKQVLRSNRVQVVHRETELFGRGTFFAAIAVNSLANFPFHLGDSSVLIVLMLKYLYAS